MSERPEPAPPESIELDGVSYVPRLWLQSGRDALDTCCNQLTATERDLAAALARAVALRERVIRAELARAEAEARVRKLEATLGVLLTGAEQHSHSSVDVAGICRDALSEPPRTGLTLASLMEWTSTLIAAGDRLAQRSDHHPTCWITVGGVRKGSSDYRCTCAHADLVAAWERAKEGAGS